MLLQRLTEYADRLDDLPPMLYVKAPVRYIISLDAEGNLLERKPRDTSDKESKRGLLRIVPQIKRSGISAPPFLLADKAEYSLGYTQDETKRERAVRNHQAYIDLVKLCAEKTQEPTVYTVLKFLQSNPLEKLELGEDFDPSAVILFQVEFTFPTDLTSVQEFWAEYNNPTAASEQNIMQCIVCGKLKPVLDRLQGNIKGVLGGQPSGTAIISANAEAFESYGLEASLIAPTCANCAEQFTKALNSLINKEKGSSRLYLGGATFVYWTREEVGFDFFGEVSDPTPEQVEALLQSAQTGKFAQVDATAFYAVSLSASVARTVVRDWIDTTVGAAKESLAVWFTRQNIVGYNGEKGRPLGVFLLAVSTVRDGKDLTPAVSRSLLHAALTGSPLPDDLLYRAVQRNRAEQEVTRQRAALIKLVLLSNSDKYHFQEDTMVQLDPNHPSPAYQCGRLLCTLEEAQKAAIPGINATLVDRYYGAASSAPASVFSQLLKNLQAHLSKLERDNRGMHYRLQELLEDILGQLKGFPNTLSLPEQGLFALGYYHQRAYNRAQAIEGAERRKARQTDATLGREQSSIPTTLV